MGIVIKAMVISQLDYCNKFYPEWPWKITAIDPEHCGQTAGGSHRKETYYSYPSETELVFQFTYRSKSRLLLLHLKPFMVWAFNTLRMISCHTLFYFSHFYTNIHYYKELRAQFFPSLCPHNTMWGRVRVADSGWLKATQEAAWLSRDLKPVLPGLTFEPLHHLFTSLR